MHKTHVLFIKRGFQCGIQTYANESDIDFVYADEVDNFDEYDHLVVHSGPHMSHGPVWCKEQYMKVLEFTGKVELIVHERTYEVAMNMLGYKRLGKKATRIRLHSFDSDLCDFFYKINPNAEFKPLYLPYKRKNVPYKKTKCAVFIGRDSVSKPAMPAKQYAYTNKLELDVITEFENKDVLKILGQYRYAILPMRVEGSFSLEYTALEALDAGCHLILHKSWRNTEAVKNHIHNITFMDRRVKK